MSDHEPIPLPDEADLARLNDALDALVAGRTARVPGTIAADQAWLEAFAAVREALRHEAPDTDRDTARETALDAALAVFDTEFVAPVADGSAVVATPPTAAPAPADAVDHDTAAADDDTPDATVVRPLRWRRTGLLAAAAAGILVVGVAVSSLQGRSADLDMSGAESMATAAGGAMDAAAADTATPPLDNGAPGPTINAINEPAVAAPALETTDQLLALARAYDADTAANTGSTASPAETMAVATADQRIAGYDGCLLGPDQVVLAEVLWQGTLGMAVYDTVTGAVSVVDPACTVLVTTTP
ncbi:MAG: hypothetical protein ACO3C1_06660 [Ilumatobacteraceae bacterium]